MTEISKTEAAVKPVATIKTPVVTPEVKLAVATVKEEVKKTEPKAVIEKKVEPKKPAAKKAAAPKKAVAKKAEPKAAEKKTEAKEAVAKKPAAKKAAAPKKTAAKKPAAKKTTTAKAADVNVSIELQYSYKHVTYDELIQNAKNHYQYEMGGNVDEIKSLSIYVKPQEDAAYYVVNDKVQSRIGL